MTLEEAIRNCEEDNNEKVDNDKVICKHCQKEYDMLYLELTGITRCEKCHYNIKTRFYDIIQSSREKIKSKREQRIKRFGQELKFYRKTNRYTAKEIGAILGVHQNHVNSYERGKAAPSKEMQEIIYQKFGIRY